MGGSNKAEVALPTISSMNMRPKPSAVIFAKQIDTVARFYSQVVVMDEVHRDANHIVLNQDSFQLVVHGIPKSIAETFEITVPPVVREDLPIKICLPVTSIATSFRKSCNINRGAPSRIAML